LVNPKLNHMNKICFSFLALLFVTGCQQTPEVRETVRRVVEIQHGQ
jgi:uncharacterized lipoprotein YajG